ERKVFEFCSESKVSQISGASKRNVSRGEPVTTPGRDEIEPRLTLNTSPGMSLKRLAVISAVGSHNSFNNQTISYVSSYSGASGSVEQSVIVGHAAGNGGNVRTSGGHHQGLQTMRPGANLHGNVNIMLGG
uniref:Uncharacterized protein n=1 Tax=Anopheles maculatus TaxID=74869 RepID=A0A182SIX2_9DIPT